MTGPDRSAPARLEPDMDRFFDHHLAGVVSRLEASASRALERQRLARRDTLRREAVLEDRHFEHSARH